GPIRVLADYEQAFHFPVGVDDGSVAVAPGATRRRIDPREWPEVMSGRNDPDGAVRQLRMLGRAALRGGFVCASVRAMSLSIDAYTADPIGDRPRPRQRATT